MTRCSGPGSPGSCACAGTAGRVPGQRPSRRPVGIAPRKGRSISRTPTSAAAGGDSTARPTPETLGHHSGVGRRLLWNRRFRWPRLVSNDWGARRLRTIAQTTRFSCVTVQSSALFPHQVTRLRCRGSCVCDDPAAVRYFAQRPFGTSPECILSVEAALRRTPAGAGRSTAATSRAISVRTRDLPNAECGWTSTDRARGPRTDVRTWR
jgi:hypothetical protein